MKMGAKSVPCCSVVQKGVSMASAAAWSFGHVGRGQPPLCASLATGSAVSALLYLLLLYGGRNCAFMAAAAAAAAA
eukprot:CAMPEP_0202372704 /NCGR_PEP_ID=MMETSP1127-20130417/3853_1 /ASSEMBLY_ACC=CAM_ASM_000462 /TAXON_ID=3047 /ORGANISM="Dunaliella tertiolecta, Strain CCMP1320" /LENGTH=75 /DNA_ID=CAMNT_0048969329 /DNA_START=172 /DNA_END=397 /DNA_ORIENTATION=-